MRPGDALVLTKPFGLGILTTAPKRDLVSEREIEGALEAASQLNKPARDAMQESGVCAATDVTGFGFLGHLTEMLEVPGTGAVVSRGQIPFWEQAVPLAKASVYPGELQSNKEYLVGRIQPDGLSDGDLLPLYDPPTSGGLLLAVTETRASALVGELEERGVTGAIVGEVVEEPGIRVTKWLPAVSLGVC